MRQHAQAPGAPFTLDTGLSPHFHFDEASSHVGPYKASTLQDLPGGVPAIDISDKNFAGNALHWKWHFRQSV